MDYKIGKRYCWSPWYCGKDKWKNGLLSKIDGDCGFLETRDGETWRIPLEDLSEYKRKKG